MPKIRRVKIYPFPFLAEYTKDFKKTLFALEVSYKIEKGKVLIQATYNINNDEIIESINDDTLKVVLKVVCTTMGFSKTAEFHRDFNTVSLYYEPMQLDGDVNITAYLVANCDFTLENQDLSEFWINEKPVVQENNVLGESNERTITVAHIKSGSSKSIFKFTKDMSKEDGDPYSVFLGDSEAIVFKLSKKMYYQFTIVKSKYREFIFTSFVIPTLADILRQMIDNPLAEEGPNEFNSYYSGKKWHQVICDNYNNAFDGKDPMKGDIHPLEAAQTIIDKYALNNVLACGVSKAKGNY